MKKSKKILLALLAVVLVCGLSVMGTLAYLQTSTGPVTNTFVAAGLNANLTLDEAKAVADANNVGVYTLSTTDPRVTDNSYTLVPGVDVPKDPKVTIEKGTLDIEAYLFVEAVDASTLDWSMATGWTELSGKTGANGGKVYVWSKLTPANASTADFEAEVIAGDEVAVPTDYDPTGNETLKFYAYLCQAGGFADASAAWDACFAPAAPAP